MEWARPWYQRSIQLIGDSMSKKFRYSIIITLATLLTLGCNLEGPGVFWSAAQSEKIIPDDLSKSQKGVFEVFVTSDGIPYALTDSDLVTTESAEKFTWKSVALPTDVDGQLTGGMFSDNFFVGSILEAKDDPKVLLYAYDTDSKSWSALEYPGNSINNFWKGDTTSYITYSIGTGDERTSETVPLTGTSLGSPITDLGGNKIISHIRDDYAVILEDGNSQFYKINGSSLNKEGKAVPNMIRQFFATDEYLIAFQGNNTVYIKPHGSDTWTLSAPEPLWLAPYITPFVFQDELLFSAGMGVRKMVIKDNKATVEDPASIGKDQYVQYLQSSRIKSFYNDGENLYLGGLNATFEGSMWKVDSKGAVTRIHEVEK